MNTIGQELHFHELNLEDCLSKIQIPKIDRYEHQVFVILHFPAPDESETIAKSSQLAAAFMGAITW